MTEEHSNNISSKLTDLNYKLCIILGKEGSPKSLGSASGKLAEVCQ